MVTCRSRPQCTAQIACEDASAQQSREVQPAVIQATLHCQDDAQQKGSNCHLSLLLRLLLRMSLILRLLLRLSLLLRLLLRLDPGETQPTNTGSWVPR